MPRELWQQGHVLQAEDVPLLELARGVDVVILEGSYFNAPCQVAGTIRGVEVDRDAGHVLLQATGTDCEGLLRHCTGAPKGQLRGRRVQETGLQTTSSTSRSCVWPSHEEKKSIGAGTWRQWRPQVATSF